MNFIKNYLDNFLNLVDNGKFFREPMKGLYILNGVIDLLLPFIYFYYVFFDLKPYEYMEGWAYFTTILSLILIFVYFLVLGYCGWVFWSNRKRDLTNTVKVGDRVNAIPVVAHWIQSLGESIYLFMFLVPVGAYIIAFVIGIINGFKLFGCYNLDFGDYLKYVLILIGVFILMCIGLFVLCYLGTLFTHYISEQIRIKAQMANDLRDVADIHRAATLPEEETSATV